jgi:micrococcal nuclease
MPKNLCFHTYICRMTEVIKLTFSGTVGCRYVSKVVALAAILPLLFLTTACAGPAPAGGEVAFVIDGDTVVLDSGEKVRYLGIDAPETGHDENPGDCYGEEARKANADWVLHKKVKLRYDREKTDSYGRLLAYVILPEGGCVNELMLQYGYAFLFKPVDGFGRMEEFLARQRTAIRERRGMWAACAVQPESFYLGNRSSSIFHRPRCSLGKGTASRNQNRFQDRWNALHEGYRPCRQCKP